MVWRKRKEREIFNRYGAGRKPYGNAGNYSDCDSGYKGRYVAVVGKRVVASGTKAKQVWLEAKRKNPTARPELQSPESLDARV